MNWDLTGLRINGMYMGLFPVQGTVRLSRVKYGGGVCHHIDLEEPITVYGAVRNSVILEHEMVNRVVDINE